MSDDEDNQSLIDEIQALEDALEEKRTSNNNEGPSTSGISSIKVLPKVEANCESEQNEDDSFSEQDDEDLVIDDFCESYSCDDLQDLLELNKKLIDSVTAVREKMVLLLEECLAKKNSISEQMSRQTNACSTHSKIINFNAGMPYFKDKEYFPPQRNEDTKTKIRNGELRLTELQRIQRWNQMDKSNLLKAIKHEVLSTSLKRDQPDTEDSITKTSQLPSDVKEAIGSLGSMKFDWMKIANNMPERKHNAEECEVMWNVFLHPQINKKKWTPKEDKNLNRIVEEYEFEDWNAIARELGTERSGYQCFVRYNTNNWKNLMKGQSWSPVDDENLVHLVTRLKIGDFIPWGYIARCMNSWTKQQVLLRTSYNK